MSVQALVDAVEDLHLGLDRAEIAAAFSARDRLDALLALRVADYEAAALHTKDSALTIQAWLRSECGRDTTTAHRIAVTGRKLRDLPALRDAVLGGRITGGQLRIVLAHVPQRHLARFAEHEHELVPLLEGMTVEDTRRAMEHWRACADDTTEPDADADDPPDEVHVARTLGGRGDVHASLGPDSTALLEAALRVADPKDLGRSLSQRRADALAQICQHFLDHQQLRRGGRHRPHLNVRVDLDQLLAGGPGARYLETDAPVSPAALGVLACDSAYHRFLFSGASAQLDYGRATRSWPVDLYNAIVLRDGGCRIGDCTAPASWCDVHHIHQWQHGGSTSIDDGVLGCHRHHRLAHTPGWHLKLLPDGTTELTGPDGRTWVNHPRGAGPPDLFGRPPPPAR